ncbi:MAG: RnfABCDGE type electron transport complex subunit G [Gammaproteobacteria bacterium]|nr:RnfABCDGE type electron transport complex subunit G [Gammaproteobacteria bacterium]
MKAKNIIEPGRESQTVVSASRIILTLAIAGLISGVAIVGIYEATFDTIAENRARELRDAVFTVLPGIDSMREMVYREGQLVEGKAAIEEPSVYAGYDSSGEFKGYAIPARGPGFQDTIVLLYGYRMDTGRIVGMQVLESRETPGLGDKIFKDPEFVAEFNSLEVQPGIVLVKGGSRAGNEVDAITGATISSRAVVRIINQANEKWLSKLTLQHPIRSNGKGEK